MVYYESDELVRKRKKKNINTGQKTESEPIDNPPVAHNNRGRRSKKETDA